MESFMAKISRTEKYKDLRDSLAHDVGQEIESRELYHFQKRLNQLDSTNFEAPRVTPAADHDPIHARRTHLSRSQNVENTENLNFNLDNDNQYQDLYQTESFHNDYLDRYINEVKKYNIEQGNAVSEYTSVNVLDGLRKDNKEKTSRPVRPYPEERRESRQPVMPQQEEASVPRNPKDIAAEVQNLADEASDYFEEEIEVPGLLEKAQKNFLKTGKRTIILIDEFDRFFGKDVSNKFISEMKGILESCSEDNHVTFFLTTNKPQKIPYELRNSHRIEPAYPLDPPNKTNAVAVIEHYLQGCDTQDLDYNTILNELFKYAPDEIYSNTHLKAICELAADVVKPDESPLTTDMFLQAIEQYNNSNTDHNLLRITKEYLKQYENDKANL